jgi:3-deoxy-D-manno-octulosonate 8-phosphate phosphatase (KDO 8-P phosphatase)
VKVFLINIMSHKWNELLLKQRLAEVTHFVFDVDGVMTDGTIGCLASGEMFRTFNVRDGYAFDRAVGAGYEICIITGGNQEGVRKRMEYLKVKHIYMGSGGKSKLDIYLKYLSDNNIDESKVLYMGDDIPDLEVMKRSSLLSVCPMDAVQEIIEGSKAISTKSGGHGAVREVIEWVMKAQNKW